MFKKKKAVVNENDLYKEKYFLKYNIIQNRLKGRGLGFYKKEYSNNLTVSLVFSVLSAACVLFGTLSIETKNAEHRVYLTNVNGQIEKYNAKTENRIKTIREAYNYRNTKGK